jgi:hypothetical protein
LFSWAVSNGRGKSEIMGWLIVSEIVDFSSRAGLKSIISDNINKSIISDFPLYTMGNYPELSGFLEKVPPLSTNDWLLAHVKRLALNWANWASLTE